ncbi:uncharacterized protein LOC108734896 isoform X2 [Agrilus planipennis]|uniref:Uncharacterized protein LOC108734896 isoform X2 n=1 Tax=Agrilus planipennis TaxID=224129 RepID=A0A1W4WDX7_AGRPL|nr:uncharacterized protein LOC108734896 isoform X2 [Agrilus planipennis]
MYGNTLAGVFPEPKAPQKRNFVKENVRQIKRIQNVMQRMSQEGKTQASKDKFQTVPANQRPVPVKAIKPIQKISANSLAQKKTSEKNIKKAKKQKNQKISTETQLIEESAPRSKEPSGVSSFRRNDKFVTRGIQTEKTDNLEKFLETGVIKYASDKLSTKPPNKKVSPPTTKRFESGDAPLNSPEVCRIFETNKSFGDSLTDKINSLNLNEKPHDFIKENIMALRDKSKKNEAKHDPCQPPAGYQKGHLPKYLKERREEQKKEVEKLDIDCPEGHVLLPDEERRETLRVLRQSYADRIQELNSMPVRNDTLRMRRRKMEIEEELKKIDEGIKVFQRPKVYVKINA